MIETTIGLPNTCSECGKPVKDTWFAAHEDAARAGLGVCKACLQKREKAGKKTKAKPDKGGEA